MNKEIRVALVDDEQLFLEGLSLLLSSNEKLEVVATSDNGPDFLESLTQMAEDSFPEVALIDINMKPMDGFELVEKLKKRYPSMNIIILSSHYKNAMFGHMIRLGVSAFLPKNASRELLVEAIEKVDRTGVFFTEKDHEMLASFVKSDSPNRYFNSSDSLTEREVEVLQLICSEYTNQEIAEKLFLSKRTVESHRQRILDKIEAKNTAGLVIYAISQELFTPKSKNYF
jgi:DNA-binding NarL/FixJ family response regulator